MTGEVADRAESASARLFITANCLVVVRAEGVFIQQPVMARPWPLDLAQLELLRAIDLADATDATDAKRVVVQRTGVPEEELNAAFRRLRMAKNVDIGAPVEHPEAPDHPTTAVDPEPIPIDDGADVTLRVPLTLRLREGTFEIIDNDGYRRAALTPVEVTALAHLGRPTTAALAHARHLEVSGPLALDERAMGVLLARLETAGVLDRRPAGRVVTAPDAAPSPVAIEAEDREGVIRRVFDRHAEQQTAAERERERATGVKRVKVIPVAFDMGTPTALGMLIAYAKVHDGGALEEFYNFRTDWVWSEDRLEEFTAEPAIYLFSNYLWSHRALPRGVRPREGAEPGEHHHPRRPGHAEVRSGHVCALRALPPRGHHGPGGGRADDRACSWPPSAM